MSRESPFLRLLLVVAACVLFAGSLIGDQIVGAVAIGPALLVALIVSIALVSADLVRPRTRLAIWCSALSIVAPYACLIGGLVAGLGRNGIRAGAVALVVLQLLPLVRRHPAVEGEQRAAGPRRVVAALVAVTGLLLITVAALVWYGSAYLVRPPTTTFTRSPYLVRVTTTGAALEWRLKDGSDPVTLRALAPDGTGTRATDGVFRNLQPDTRYLWTANIAGHAAATGSFHTAPGSSTSPITLVAFGDYGSGNAHEYAVGRLAAAVSPALMLSAGDNSYLLAAPPLLDRAIFDPLRPLLAEAPMVAALGEHDIAWNDGSAVISALDLPGHHYAVQYGPVQIVVLGLQADSSALSYARRTLGHCSTPCPIRFVLTHRVIEASNPIMSLLLVRHVSAIIAGHLHRYERHVRSGVLEFTVGTGGEGPGSEGNTKATPDALRSFIAYGFLRIQIAGSRIRYQFIDQQGRVLDRTAQTIPH